MLVLNVNIIKLITLYRVNINHMNNFLQYLLCFSHYIVKLSQVVYHSLFINLQWYQLGYRQCRTFVGYLLSLFYSKNQKIKQDGLVFVDRFNRLFNQALYECLFIKHILLKYYLVIYTSLLLVYVKIQQLLYFELSYMLINDQNLKLIVMFVLFFINLEMTLLKFFYWNCFYFCRVFELVSLEL